MKQGDLHDDDDGGQINSTSNQWLMLALRGVSDDIKNVASDVREFRAEVKADNKTIDERLRKLEIKAALLIGGIIVALAFASFMGWILAPVIRVLVENTIGG